MIWDLQLPHPKMRKTTIAGIPAIAAILVTVVILAIGAIRVTANEAR